MGYITMQPPQLSPQSELCQPLPPRPIKILKRLQGMNCNKQNGRNFSKYFAISLTLLTSSLWYGKFLPCVTLIPSPNLSLCLSSVLSFHTFVNLVTCKLSQSEAQKPIYTAQKGNIFISLYFHFYHIVVWSKHNRLAN